MIDYFDQKLALNDLTSAPLPNAIAQVYAVTDTAFAEPLPITDISGLPMAELRASPSGIYPVFRCAGHTQVIARSGGILTPITSLLGHILLLLPDPAGGYDGQVLGVVAGGYELVDSSGGGGGGGTGASVFYNASTSAWGMRPAVTYPVMFVSTNSPTAPRPPSMATFDMWVQHPGALEAP